MDGDDARFWEKTNPPETRPPCPPKPLFYFSNETKPGNPAINAALEAAARKRRTIQFFTPKKPNPARSKVHH
ncbi:MAG: hypothetical protein D6714_13620, partial [Bacteroidetes bacterium]